MKTRSHPRPAPTRTLWSHRIWPLLAGTATAVGVFAVSTTFGPVALLAMYASLSMFAIATVWGLSLESGIGRSSVVRGGFSAALVVLVTVGLCLVHPVWGLLVVVVLGVSSPTALTLLASVRPRTTGRRTDLAARPTPGVLIDKAMLDRRFDEIVSQIRESGDFPET